MKMDSFINSLFTAPKKTSGSIAGKVKPVNAKRKKIRTPRQMVNYITGNGLVDWLVKHPEDVNVKFLPVKFKITFKTAKDLFIEEQVNKFAAVKVLTSLKSGKTGKASKAKEVKWTVLTPSDYGCQTILAMRDHYDIIFNATLVDRPAGRMAKVDALVKSSVINSIFKTSYTDNHESQFSEDWHYVPMCYMDHRVKTDKTVAEMNIAIAVSVLSKYQKYQPDIGFIVEDASTGLPVASTYRPVNYTLIRDGSSWLDQVDEMTDDPVLGANAKISCESPWYTAVKYRAFEQENSSMLPNTICAMDCTNWSSIEEEDADTDWVDNYYDSSGSNMEQFKEFVQQPGLIFVSVSELDGIPYQATVLDVATGATTHIVAESLNNSDVLPRLREVVGSGQNVWSWGMNPYVVGLTGLNIQDLRGFCVKNMIKFPFSTNYDLDLIGFRALSEDMHDKIPVVNFSLTEVAMEYYDGTPDIKTRKQLLECMKRASLHDPMIMYLLSRF